VTSSGDGGFLGAAGHRHSRGFDVRNGRSCRQDDEELFDQIGDWSFGICCFQAPLKDPIRTALVSDVRKRSLPIWDLWFCFVKLIINHQLDKTESIKRCVSKLGFVTGSVTRKVIKLFV
jgi:hypothetical protein